MFVFPWQIDGPKPVGSFLHVHERVVRCKHHPIYTDIVQQEMKQVILKERAGCEPEVVMEVLLERLVQAVFGHSPHLFQDAFIEERKALPHVADDDL